MSPSRHAPHLGPLVAGLLLLNPGAGRRAHAEKPRKTPGPVALARAGDADPDRFLEMFARSWTPSSSPQIFFVVKPGYVFSDPAVAHDHGTPWDYDIHVPMAFYGPGVVKAQVVTEPSRPYDVTATLAAALGIPGPPAMTGHAFTEVLKENRPRPKVVVHIMLDQVGYDDLVPLMDRLPNLSRFRRAGAWFEACRLDYLPSSTAVSHAAVGTGSPPGISGVSANTRAFHGEKGWYQRPIWYRGPDQLDPTVVQVPTLADWLDRMFHNVPIIVSSVSKGYAAGGLAGHGSAFHGGDKDILIFYSKKTHRFATDEDYYQIPDYIASKTVITDEIRERYPAYGMPGPVESGVLAMREYARMEGENIIEIMDREGVGSDDVPDLILVNLKSTDTAGHFLGHEHPAYGWALEEVDRFVGNAETFLRERVGASRYLFSLTADHGLCPGDGAWVDRQAWTRDLGARLDAAGDQDGVSAMKGIEPGLLWVDLEELAEEGQTLEDVKARVLEDDRILVCWTEDEVRERRRQMERRGASGLE